MAITDQADALSRLTPTGEGGTATGEAGTIHDLDLREVVEWLGSISVLRITSGATLVRGTVYLYDASTPFAASLPSPIARTVIGLKGSGALTLNALAGTTIAGQASFEPEDGDAFILLGTGANWVVVRVTEDIPDGEVPMRLTKMSSLVLQGGAAEPSDTVAPTIVSVTITAALPTRASVVYSEAVTGAVTGLTIGGTFAPTVDSIVSGNGTTTVVYQLSHAALGQEDWTFDHDGTVTIVDEADNALEPGSTPVTLSGSFPADILDALIVEYGGFWLWARDAVVTSGVDIDSIPMRVSGITAGSVAQGTAAQKPHLVTISGRQFAQFIAADSMNMVATQAASVFAPFHQVGGSSNCAAFRFTAGAILGHVYDTGFSGGAVNQTGIGLSCNTSNGNLSGGVCRGGVAPANQCTATGTAAATSLVVSHVWDETIGGSLQVNNGAPVTNGPGQAPSAGNPTATYTLAKYAGSAIQFLDMHLACTVHLLGVVDGADLDAMHEASAALSGATLA